MTVMSVFVLSPFRFEYLVSTLGLGYTDALTRVALGEFANLAARLTSVHVRRLLSPASPLPASSSRGKLKAA